MGALLQRWTLSIFVDIIATSAPTTGLHAQAGLVCLLQAILLLLVGLIWACGRFFCRSIGSKVCAPREQIGQEIFRS
jgi:hypothetical protein